jgi:Fe-S-cluster containining protein
MNVPEEIKRKILFVMYSVLNSQQEDLQLACQKGCSSCCTQSVMMTELEGEVIVDFYDKHIGRTEELYEFIKNNDYSDSKKNITPNTYARQFLEKQCGQEESSDWCFQPCVFLKDGTCTIYPVRPLGCRAFISEIDCKKNGTAEVKPITITKSVVLQQLTEHLDKGRMWGALNKMMLLISSNKKSQQDLSMGIPLPGFLIPQEERDEVDRMVDIIFRTNIGKNTIYDYFFSEL